MSANDPEKPRPERPRAEPEIIPPGQGGRGQNGLSGIWIGVEERDGVRRVVFKRPGMFSIIFGLLVVGLIVAAVFLLLAGLVLIWVPLVVVGILFALLSVSARQYWWRLKSWWAGGRPMR